MNTKWRPETLAATALGREDEFDRRDHTPFVSLLHLPSRPR